MSGKWKPGDVAVATVRGVPDVRVLRIDGSNEGGSWHPWASDRSVGGAVGHRAEDVTDIRPLVTLDLDLAAHIGVGRLVADLRTGGFYDLADQIEAQSRPPKRTVYEHLVVRRVATAAESACGKQWTPGEDVTVVGRCPECQDIAEGGWTA